MAKDPKEVRAEETASAANLFADPVAGVAAMSALGIGLAGHAFGVWMGALTGAAEVSQRLLEPLAKDASRRMPVENSAVADDLKAISGIGPKLEQVLNGLGIRFYGQVAALTSEEIAAIEGTLGLGGRIVRDDWMGQAAALDAARTKH